jgi:predicted phosphodiesterase
MVKSLRDTIEQMAKQVPDEATKEIRKLRQSLEEEKRKTESLKTLIKEQDHLIADYHASRFDIPKQVIAKYRTKDSYVRVAFGDTHGSSIDLQAWGAFLDDVRMLAPREVVHLGDIVECGGWLAAHHTTNYVAQTEYTYSDDIIAANLMTDQLQKACPKAAIHYIEGNHDARIATWCITMAQKKRADVEFLIDKLGPRSLLSIDKRRIHWWSRGDVHEGSVVGGTLKLGKCFFTHPQSSSKHHAATTAAKFGHNVVYGHTHRADFYPGGDVEGREWAAWSPGCLCKLRKYWHHTEPFRHNHGYHVQLVKPDGTFLGINVPIINGKSYLSGLLKIGSAA